MRKLSETASQWNEPSKHAQEVSWLQCQGQKMWGGRDLGDKGAHAESNKNCNQSQQLWWYPTFPGEQTNPSCAVLLESNCRDKNKMCPQTTQMQTARKQYLDENKKHILREGLSPRGQAGCGGYHLSWDRKFRESTKMSTYIILFLTTKTGVETRVQVCGMTQPLCKPCSIFYAAPDLFLPPDKSRRFLPPGILLLNKRSEFICCLLVLEPLCFF